MLDRFQPLLKLVCVALGALLLFQIVQRLWHSDPLGHAAIPPLPTLSAPTNAAPKTVEATNTSPKITGTNAVTVKTNAAPSSTNEVSTAKGKGPRRARGMAGRMGGASSAVKLPSNIQARVDHIKESEILGPFMRPPPLGLLGIADDVAFLRSPDGQTGLVKVGHDLGGVKLLRIGINRVLVEQDGEKKELTLFEGFGSESLMPAETNSSTNKITQPIHKENP